MGFLGVTICNVVFAQEEAPKLPPKFFTLREARLAFGVGFDASLTSSIINTTETKNIKAIFKDPRKPGETNYPYLSIGGNFDLFSDNSLIGLLIGANYNLYKQGFQSGDSAVDFFEMDRVEFTGSLKFRPGYFNDTSHLWFLLGGSYSIPLTCKREHFNPPTTAINNYIDNNKDQLNSVFSIGLSIGFESYWDRRSSLTRLVIYISGNYPLTSTIKKDYRDFKSGGKSVFSRSPDFAVQELRGIIGVKLLFGKRKK